MSVLDVNGALFPLDGFLGIMEEIGRNGYSITARTVLPIIFCRGRGTKKEKCAPNHCKFH